MEGDPEVQPLPGDEAAGAEPAAPAEEQCEESKPEPLTPEMETELHAAAKADIKAQNFEAAIDKFSNLLRHRVETFGEAAPETAPAYYDYGDAVLRSAECSMDLFGGDGKEQQDGAAAGEGEVDDLEIAWENLEVAANIYRGCDGKPLELARVLLR